MAFGNLDSGRGCSGHGKLRCQMLVICHWKKQGPIRHNLWSNLYAKALVCICIKLYMLVDPLPAAVSRVSYWNVYEYMNQWWKARAHRNWRTFWWNLCLSWRFALTRGRDRAWDITRQACDTVMTNSFIRKIYLLASVRKSGHKTLSNFPLFMVLITLLQSYGIHLHLGLW